MKPFYLGTLLGVLSLAGCGDKDKTFTGKAYDKAIMTPGEIVVGMIGDEATVKRFYKEKGTFRLQPENPDFEPIISDEITILGKVIAVIRYY